MRSRFATSSLAAIGLAVATLTGIVAGAASITAPAAAAGTYTVADVQAHKTAASCWSIVDGNVYDLTSWINVHRGGAAVITGMCGIDASTAFHGMHGVSGKAVNTLAGFKIGTIGTPTPGATTPAPTPSPTTSTPPAVTPCAGGDDDDDEDGDDDHASSNCGSTDTRTAVVGKQRLSIESLLALSPAALAAMSADKLEKFKGSSKLRNLSPTQLAALNSKQIKALGLNKVKLSERQKRALEKSKKHN